MRRVWHLLVNVEKALTVAIADALSKFILAVWFSCIEALVEFILAYPLALTAAGLNGASNKGDSQGSHHGEGNSDLHFDC
ncbi:MAG: hypothetical protein J3R72DRAFT_448151 [Linnemannia gamsii]|nr:MAG: hypothetical protein J3R72DRAFT_448151 [Linnemannia gamsii]